MPGQRHHRHLPDRHGCRQALACRHQTLHGRSPGSVGLRRSPVSSRTRPDRQSRRSSYCVASAVNAVYTPSRWKCDELTCRFTAVRDETAPGQHPGSACPYDSGVYWVRRRPTGLPTGTGSVPPVMGWVASGDHEPSAKLGRGEAGSETSVLSSPGRMEHGNPPNVATAPLQTREEAPTRNRDALLTLSATSAAGVTR